MKSITSISQKDITEKWYLVNAEGQRIGTLASKVAEVLQGKLDPMARAYHKPTTKVVIVNAEKIDFTAKKGMTKFYKNYSGFPGGLRYTSLEELAAKHPEKPLVSAISGMLPKTKRADQMMANLKIFAGSEHNHVAQNPETLDLRKLKI